MSSLVDRSLLNVFIIYLFFKTWGTFMKIDFRQIIFYLPANVQGLSYHLNGYIKEMDIEYHLIFVVVVVVRKKLW